MVAHSEKLSGKRSRQANGKFEQIPILTRIKVKGLYLHQCASHQEIAAACGITKEASQRLVNREGWSKIRREKRKLLSERADARMEEVMPEVVDALVDATSQHAIRGMERVGEALDAKGEFAARDFQSWTGGVKNLVSIMRELRPAEQTQAAGNAGLNVFVVRVGESAAPKQASERNVTPNTQAGAPIPASAAIELPKSQPSHVS